MILPDHSSKQRDLLSVKELAKQDILNIFNRADRLRKDSKSALVNTKKVNGLLFFEPSTRTRIGFEVAAWKLGIKSVIMGETKHTSAMSEAESMPDTIRTLNPYVDFYCVRHPSENIFEQILPYTKHPVINCGNGYDGHPTQALIDAYAIWNRFGHLDGLTITMIGALRYSRAAHSLLLLLSKFSGVTVNGIAPAKLAMPPEYSASHIRNGNIYMESTVPDWGREQVVYSAGFAPKNPSGTFSLAVRRKYQIAGTTVEQLATNCIILNPLPRIDEIARAVDSLPNAYYFKQNKLGLYVRMAIIERYSL